MLNESNHEKPNGNKDVEEREVHVYFCLFKVVVKLLSALSQDVTQECCQEDAAGEAVEVSQEPFPAPDGFGGSGPSDDDEVRNQAEQHRQDEQQDGCDDFCACYIHGELLQWFPKAEP